MTVWKILEMFLHIVVIVIILIILTWPRGPGIAAVLINTIVYDLIYYDVLCIMICLFYIFLYYFAYGYNRAESPDCGSGQLTVAGLMNNYHQYCSNFSY